jgi:hypothetical protein
MQLGIPVYEGVNLLDVEGPMKCSNESTKRKVSKSSSFRMAEGQ